MKRSYTPKNTAKTAKIRQKRHLCELFVNKARFLHKNEYRHVLYIVNRHLKREVYANAEFVYKKLDLPIEMCYSGDRGSLLSRGVIKFSGNYIGDWFL
jgi:hypothetical protein